jgi:hypothetical protein
MTNLTKLAAIALAALVASTAIATAGGPPPLPKVPQVHPQRPHHHGIVDLECKMKGFDFWIINFGNDNVDSGRQVSWSSPTTDDGAVITLPKMLAPGEELRLADVLSDVPAQFAPCDASFA